VWRCSQEKPDILGEEDAGLVAWRYLDENISPTPLAGKHDVGPCPSPEKAMQLPGQRARRAAGSV
jgi:hypothetical protein